MNVIVITGASSGMGREFALQLDRGLKTIDEFWLVARRADRMKELSGHMRHRVKILPLDLTAEGDISLFGEVLQEERPKIRMLVNCAGYGLIGDFSALSAQEQAGEVMLNCRALMEITHACLPYMKAGGRILEICSTAAFQPFPYLNVYAASKAFLYRYSLALGRELRRRRITVTAVCPYWVKDTAFIPTATPSAGTPAVRHFPLASRSRRVVARALLDSRRGRAVSTPGPVCTFHRAAAKALPAGVLMSAWEVLRKI